MLLALTSAVRASDIAYLDTRYLIKHPSGYIFQFGKNKNFSENKNLCVCHRIDLYLDKIKEFHKIEAQLLLSFIKPHKGVTTQTIFRWILEVLIYRELIQKFSPVIQQGLLALQKLKHQVYLQMI